MIRELHGGSTTEHGAVQKRGQVTSRPCEYECVDQG